MSNPFCNNPKCMFHQYNDSSSYIRVFIDRTEREISRYEYYSCMTGKRYYLCDVCHNAVQMTVNGRGHN